MPDETREVVFPNGAPVALLDAKQQQVEHTAPPESSSDAPRSKETDAISTQAEAGLSNEAGMLQEQARQTKLVGESENPLGAIANIRTAKANVNGLENS